MINLILPVLLFFGLSAFSQEEILPQQVENSYKAKYPDAYDLQWSMEEDIYNLEFYISGDLFTSTFDKDGKWLETAQVIADDEIPAVLQEYIEKNFPEAAITYVEKIETNSMGYYFRVNLEDDVQNFFVKSDSQGGNIEVIKNDIDF